MWLPSSVAAVAPLAIRMLLRTPPTFMPLARIVSMMSGSAAVSVSSSCIRMIAPLRKCPVSKTFLMTDRSVEPS